MAVPLSLGPVHHLRLTVTNVERSKAFYTELLGFQIAMDTPHRPTTPTTTWSPTCSRTASSWSTATCSWGCVR
jgi:catechol 2,3-dioxygenase-like lactoylglutathione lyase family enzyme